MEHYFQAMKFIGTEQFEKIHNSGSPKQAKALGQSRAVPIRKDWDSVKEEVMLTGLRAKFKDPFLKELLLSTGKKTLVVRFGEKFGVIEFILCICVGALTPVCLVWMTGRHYGLLLALLTLIPAVPVIRSMCSNPSAEKLNSMLGETGRLMVIYSVLFAIGSMI